ncbi:PAS domain-containing hybrid sensor histidine kinase/response regulator [Shewanella sp. NIFS-20-20]|uniref:hybrid sensor histidine kinase/response regulator n=1 Tax=Shewanella sp. NIFS-20-20 TaxID=2853806 RepID=UPI001C46E091|nr:NahK/ErcS family hybrid sensor histidine kinase/response regulator [Shewanella sp. NIFS-20-20]MBV7315366.1 PAS-domain containing protein [Shewanella sp. NIFS-20-20]
MADRQALLDRIAALTLKNQQQQHIIDALINRVERRGSNNLAPYDAFQHSVILAEQVRAKTEQLNQALLTLEQRNAEVTSASSLAAQAHQRFVDAIESMTDGFALFDSQHKLIYFNQIFSDYWHEFNLVLATGTSYAELKEYSQLHGLIRQGSLLAQAQGSWIYQDPLMRWWQVLERATADNGLVLLYKDISMIKHAEAARFEAAMAEKSRVLQVLIDNLSQGVVMVDAQQQVQVVNQRFAQMVGINEAGPLQGKRVANLKYLPLPLECRDPQAGEANDDAPAFTYQDSVFDIRSHPITDGGFVNTYTDITQAHQSAQTLRENARWLRLITDNVPALIAYIRADYTYQFTNKGYDEWYGWPRGALLNRHLRSSRSAEEYAAMTPFLAQAMAGQAVTFELEEANASAQICVMRKTYVPNINAEGRVVGIFVLNWDITDSKRSAEALAQAYQHLELRVQERTAQYQELNGQLLAEINERRRMEQRLLDAKKEAERANLSKTKFLAAISHDLLQPLNAAQLYTGSLAETALAADSRKLVTSVSHSLADVGSLISMLVDISKLDAGIVRADKQAFRVKDLLDNIAKEFAFLGHEKGLVVRYVPCGAVIYSDPQLLARIVRNLLSNAIRYTLKGKVLLGCRLQQNEVIIQVCDSGKGIPAEKQQEIFQEFKQLANQGNDIRSGLGLGLAIVDKISNVLGHNVQVISQVNQGSVFSVRVPRGEEQAWQPEGPNPALLHSVALQGARVWVIDNDANIAEAMALLLSQWGCEVVVAKSWSELQILRDITAPVELLIVDYHLDDEQTGTELAKTLNEQRHQAVPTLVLSANRSDELKQQARAEGYAILHKPVVPMRLKMMLIQLLQQQGYQPD